MKINAAPTAARSTNTIATKKPLPVKTGVRAGCYSVECFAASTAITAGVPTI